MSSWNRREILKGSSLLGLGLITEGVCRGMMQRAWAESVGATPRRYLGIQLTGAPPRWMFDLFLSPYGREGLVSNPMIGTRYLESGGRYTSVSYETYTYQGMEIPYLWQFNVPAPGGGSRPMVELLENLLVIQGIDTKNPGHSGSQALHFLPPGAAESIPGLNAGSSPAPFAGVMAGVFEYSFKSSSGKSPVTLSSVPGENYFQELLQSFSVNLSSGFADRRERLSGQLEEAISKLNELTTDRYPSASIIGGDSQAANSLISGDVGNLIGQWDTILGKYQDLIRRAIRQTIPGINDRPIGVTGARGVQYNLNAGVGGNQATMPDLRDLITENTNIDQMAEQFAVAELLLVNNLSYSVNIGPKNFVNLSLEGNSVLGHNPDEHTTGAMPSLFLNSMYYLAYSSCLLALIDELKAAGIYSETLIDSCGEFNRNPRADEAGSDHGYLGKSVSLMSGAIDKFQVIGDLKANGSDPNYPGSWGEGAIVPDVGSVLGINHMAATIAYLLKANSPVTSADSLVYFDGTELKSKIGLTKIV